MMTTPRRGEFCSEHFSWLCQAGQGKCRPTTLPVGASTNLTECTEGVTRRGEFVPCEKTAVAVRIDPEEGDWYSVCAYHARADMVPLSTLLVAFARQWDTREERSS